MWKISNISNNFSIFAEWADRCIAKVAESNYNYIEWIKISGTVEYLRGCNLKNVCTVSLYTLYKSIIIIIIISIIIVI